MEDDLMNELENFILSEKDNIEQSDDSTEFTDWDLITKHKKGTDKTNNKNICLLENLKLDSHVFQKALSMYQTTIKHSDFKNLKFKNAIMCASVYIAFFLDGDHREELSLITYFSIDKKKYTKGLKLVKLAVEEARCIKNSFYNELFSICRDMNILHELSNIKSYISKHIDNASSYNLKTSEKAVSCSLIYIWLIENKNTIPSLESFSSICNISKNSLKKITLKNLPIIRPFLSSIIGVCIEDFLIFTKKSYDVEVSTVKIYEDVLKGILLN